MAKENEIQKTKLIVVEGNHERDFFNAWLAHIGNLDIQILPIGGKTLLTDSLSVLVRRPNFLDVVSLVIIRDADDNSLRAFQSVCSALDTNRLPVPGAVEQFVFRDVLKVAIVITPCNGLNGALEELLLKTTAADPLSSDAENYITAAVTSLNLSHARPAPPTHKLGKAKIHAYLATFDEPDKDPGKAALAGVWNFDHPALNPIRIILEQM